eukprot:TRINITY_DN3872_c0_g1_i1.p1 TRINITY_DN3872_c0_g1~~TRINITY_DN3872_c0_g1_i1.p1  ORF type:complete len:338 (-),score=70.11 TRINITY_DN3872_c0_g1_i1:4-1017(-)
MADEPSFDPSLLVEKIPEIVMPKFGTSLDEELINEDELDADADELQNKYSHKQNKPKKVELSAAEKKKRKLEQKQAAKEAVEKAKKSNAYVTGLPTDITVNELVQTFSKCGIIKRDEETAEPKIRIYTDDAGKPKGDALISFFRPESVDLALTLIDQSEIRPGYTITVQRPSFEHQNQKHTKSGAKQDKPKKRRIAKNVKTYDQSKALSWEEDENTHVVVKHMFSQQEAWADPNFFKELEEDISAECNKFGTVEKVKIFQRNPDGVVVVKFAQHFAASRCVEKMNGRFFAGRKLEAEFYDGWTNYFVEETEEQTKERLKKWSEWIESGNDENSDEDK